MLLLLLLKRSRSVNWTFKSFVLGNGAWRSQLGFWLSAQSERWINGSNGACRLPHTPNMSPSASPRPQGVLPPPPQLWGDNLLIICTSDPVSCQLHLLQTWPCCAGAGPKHPLPLSEPGGRVNTLQFGYRSSAKTSKEWNKMIDRWRLRRLEGDSKQAEHFPLKYESMTGSMFRISDRSQWTIS